MAKTDEMYVIPMIQEETLELAYTIELALEAIKRFNSRHCDSDTLTKPANQAHFIAGYLSGQYLPIKRMLYTDD